MLDITEERLFEELKYEEMTMVTADFRYPVVSGGDSKADRRITKYYRHIAKTLMRKAQKSFFPWP